MNNDDVGTLFLFLRGFRHSWQQPQVLVVMGGSTVSIPWAASNVDSILQLWYEVHFPTHNLPIPAQIPA